MDYLLEQANHLDGNGQTGTPPEPTQKKQRPLPKKPIPNALEWKETLETWDKYLDEKKAFAYAFSYLFGQRVSEILAVDIKDVTVTTDPKTGYENLNLKSKTEKNKDRPYREISVSLSGMRTLPFAQSVWEHISGLPKDSGKIFDVHRSNFFRWLGVVEIKTRAFDFERKEYVDYVFKNHPHYMRHMRATHLATDKFQPYNTTALMKFFGWSSPRYAEYYINVNATYLQNVANDQVTAYEEARKKGVWDGT